MGCGKLNPIPYQEAKVVQGNPFQLNQDRHLPQLQDFRGRPVQQFLMIIFKNDLTATEWKEVFLQTRQLSKLRGRIAVLNQQEVRSTAEEEELTTAIQESGLLVIEFYYSTAAYLVSWSQNEKCIFDSVLTKMSCKPLADIVTGENPMNGGMPRAISSLLITKNSKLDPRDQNPSAQMMLGLEHPDYGNFKVRLKLRREDRNFYQGEAVVSSGSVFIREGEVIPAYPYGYVEMRF